ncbi:glycerophosphodiester phosphodiesterase family protein [Formosa algae]|uniref:Glycerophosphoryl diester phosphodiesterase/beta-glucanase (GH16 family) n=1 Tax=Formosa algae TaxID=225843 RepID=A0A9X1C923_9FLAO|nr:family 16 glycosylhydrolase [Formosa algae]MBP1839478.1 glycerophosphoryl diester phosphodiesterase/beta-glucanase (GH16 family) [Formosa algae]MDQ0334782.1 glycerophosphoryl diester phosphodiesterase/beta-glucanase (GH16 family) [Formosa algae]OEI82029.1 licheninase [Formosa algae]
MRYLYLLLFILSLNACQFKDTPQANLVIAENPIVAHRGAWKTKGLPKNSIASLKEAIALGCTGSEFDVRMTSDEVLIVTHDAEFNDLIVDSTTYSDLSKYKLKNGETLPTLKQYLEAGMTNNTTTGLVCEIKPSKIPGRNTLLAKKVVDLVKQLKADPYILAYISFSYDILKEIRTLDQTAKTQYLDGSKAPDELKSDGISGLDYLVYKLKNKPEWISSAKANQLTLNAWTVNKAEDMDWLIANHFDYITTDEPELAFKRLKHHPTATGWKLVWSDEFNTKGKVDSTKWAFDYGFLSNQESQYFTDSLKNARVEQGHLIIEAHKEKIANKDYKSTAFKNKSWLQYITKIDTAQYTSARLKTEGLAAWQYGRIEVKAKLPKGVGLWPAIWMLGENRAQVSWPECGEIDIMEHVGFNPDSIFGTIHTKAYNHMNNTEKGKKIHIEKPYDTFHVFALEWTPEKMDFILDNTVYNQITNEHKTTAEWPFDQKFNLILNVSVGGMLGGREGIDNSVFPQQMTVDYVRVYQKDNY